MTTTGSTSSSTATSNASLGQSILNGLNANGGVDSDSLITGLTAAQKSALEDPITARQTANTAQISALSSIKSDLSTFAQSLATLIQGGSLQTQPTSSDSSIMSVSAVAGTPVGNLSESITVNALAQAQSVKSGAMDGSQSFNTGTLTLTVGSGAPITINVTSGNNTMAGLAQAINGSKAGVTATVITGSDGKSTLVLKGTTGAAQSFTIAGTDTGSGGASLSSLSYDPASSTNAMTGITAAQDASVTVDGVTVTRSSNSFSDVIPGVKMTLGKVGTVSLGATRPDDAITEAVNDFVSAYNSLMTEINSATAIASNGGTAGALQGNSAMRDLKSQLSKLTTTPLNASGSIRTLAELGVKTGQDGTLSVDSTKLSNALTNYPDDVEAMFVTSQSSSNPRVLIASTAGSAASGVYTVTGVTPAVGGDATGSINGVPMSASSWYLTATTGNDANGLQLQILSGAPDTVTITINQGLGGALQALSDSLQKKNSGSLDTLATRLSKEQDTLNDAMTKADAQVTVYHDRLVTQFATMNTLVNGYKATQSYLTQQIDLWTKSTS